MKAPDLIEVARTLAEAKPRRPKQAFLRRAISTAYYALFHALARCCADTLIGGNGAERSDPAWQQVYRALDHKYAKDQCVKNAKIREFPQAIQDFSALFGELQAMRHKADYDPFEVFAKSAVHTYIERVQLTVENFNKTSLKDKRAFAALMVIKSRRE